MALRSASLPQKGGSIDRGFNAPIVADRNLICACLASWKGVFKLRALALLGCGRDTRPSRFHASQARLLLGLGLRLIGVD